MYIYKNEKGFELRLSDFSDLQVRFDLLEKNRDFLSMWMPWVDEIKSVNDLNYLTRNRRTDFANNMSVETAIYIRNVFVGMINLLYIDWQNSSTIMAYWLGEEFTGKGFMTMACREMINYAFVTLGISRVEIRCAEQNTKSIAIPKRLGFKEEGLLRRVENVHGTFVNHVVLGLLKEECKWKLEK